MIKLIQLKFMAFNVDIPIFAILKSVARKKDDLPRNLFFTYCVLAHILDMHKGIKQVKKWPLI